MSCVTGAVNGGRSPLLESSVSTHKRAKVSLPQCSTEDCLACTGFLLYGVQRTRVHHSRVLGASGTNENHSLYGSREAFAINAQAVRRAAWVAQNSTCCSSLSGEAPEPLKIWRGGNSTPLSLWSTGLLETRSNGDAMCCFLQLHDQPARVVPMPLSGTVFRAEVVASQLRMDSEARMRAAEAGAAAEP